jgi:hypothetical protein
MVYFRILGSSIEYSQAAKRLEEIADAKPGTPEAQELKELIKSFRHFERELQKLGTSSTNQTPSSNPPKLSTITLLFFFLPHFTNLVYRLLA